MTLIRTSMLWVAVLAGGHAFAANTYAQEAIRLSESIRPGYQYHIESRVRLTGKLAIPIGPDKPVETVSMSGESTLVYDERILPGDNVHSDKAFRVYKQIDFRRTTGDRTQQVSLRPEVRRLVLVRKDNLEVPFSPDGPLTWGELDIIRTDVYSPALVGLLPTDAVQPGASWPATADAIKELTDLETIDQGSVDVTFVQVATFNQRRLAQLRLKGAVKGVNEDGPNRQTFEGTAYFDLESRHLSYVYVDGVSELLDKDGKQVGRIEGKFTLTRQAGVRPAELSDAQVGRIPLAPGPANTLLLYADDEFGVQFQYPRNWRVDTTRGRQITIDETRGSGLLLTIEPPAKVPDTQKFLNESSDTLTKFGAKITRITPPRAVVGVTFPIEHFVFEAEVGGKQSVLDYHVIRQTLAGATIAARLDPTDRDILAAEVLGIAKSLRLNKTPAVQEK